jgi:AraC-like DNA-binding protein
MGRTIRYLEGRFGRLVLAGSAEPGQPQSQAEPLIALQHDGGPSAYLVAGERLLLDRDTVVFVNPGEIHLDLGVRDGAPARALLLYASREWLREGFPAVFGAARGRPFANAREPITPRIRRLADALAVEVLNDRFLSAERLEFMLQDLVLLIVETYLAGNRDTSPLWHGSRFADGRIRHALALLRAHPHKHTSMEELADRVGLSRSRFFDLFHACTGLSPRAYLDLLCVQAAISRLASGRRKISEVAAELGFSAQSNFTRFFLHQVGISPSRYRRAAGSEPGAEESEPAQGAGG